MGFQVNRGDRACCNAYLASLLSFMTTQITTGLVLLSHKYSPQLALQWAELGVACNTEQPYITQAIDDTGKPTHYCTPCTSTHTLKPAIVTNGELEW